MQIDDENLFLWRGTIEDRDCASSSFDDLLFNAANISCKDRRKTCPYCGGTFKILKAKDLYHEFRPIINERYDCRFCGFWHSQATVKYIYEINAEFQAAVLQHFNINDSEVGLNELGSHLKRRFSDIYYLAPRRFEELAGDIFRNLGYFVRLTQQSRDGGFDLVLLENSSQEKILVECKRYAKSKTVGVTTVRQLLGVQLLHAVRKAKLITTSYFTGPAQDIARSATLIASGFEIELIDADRLLRHLDVYNEKLPPLDVVLNRD